MNQEVEERECKQRLMKASQLVRQESMKINAEFEAIENDLDILFKHPNA